MRDRYDDARRRLSKQGYGKKPERMDVNKMDYSKIERADILLSNGYREVWIREKRHSLNKEVGSQ